MPNLSLYHKSSQKASSLSLSLIEDTSSNSLQYLQYTLTYLTTREIFSYPHNTTNRNNHNLSFTNLNGLTNLNLTTKGTN